jgi:hypothetical protein
MDGTGFSAGLRVAVLVDGENMASGLAANILAAAGPCQAQIVRRVYGDVARLNGWTTKPGFELIHSHSAKNAADIRMVIDAMRLSYEGRADRFVIASSDSDFTQLARHLRERGHEVVVVVGKTAGEAIRLAATRVVEVSLPDEVAVGVQKPAPVMQAQPTVGQSKPDSAKILDVVRCIFRAEDKGQGVLLGQLASELSKSENCTLASLGVSKWGDFFRKNPQWFACDPKGPSARVRLVVPKSGKG